MKKQPLLWPDEIFSSFAEVSAAFLRARGVRALLCDIDNTLVTYDDAEPTEAVRAWLDALRAGGITVGFLSNNENARVERFNQSLGLYAKAKAGKPARRAALQFLQSTGFPPQQTALLGDQIFTDVLCARLCGLQSFLVPPIKDKKTPFFRAKRILSIALEALNPQSATRISGVSAATLIKPSFISKPLALLYTFVRNM